MIDSLETEFGTVKVTNKGKHHSDETRRKISESHKIENEYRKSKCGFQNGK